MTGSVVFVEIPSGSRNKYEFDKELGGIVLDRRLFTAMTYPADYGYVEGTLAEDGDPLDALVLVSDPTFPGCRIRVRPIGVFHMSDEKGPDEKLLCVPLDDPSFERIRDVRDVQRRAARRDRALLPALQGPRADEEDGDARLGQQERGVGDPRGRPRTPSVEAVKRSRTPKRETTMLPGTRGRAVIGLPFSESSRFHGAPMRNHSRAGCREHVPEDAACLERRFVEHRPYRRARPDRQPAAATGRVARGAPAESQRGCAGAEWAAARPRAGFAKCWPAATSGERGAIPGRFEAPSDDAEQSDREDRS